MRPRGDNYVDNGVSHHRCRSASQKIGFAVLLFGVTVLLTACVSVLPPLDDTPTSPGTPDATATLFVTVQASALSTEPSGFRPPETAR